MAAFGIKLRKTGEVGKEVQVTSATTVRELKAQEGLQGCQLYFKKTLKDADTMEGIGAGETISVWKTAPAASLQAGLRLKNGQAKRSHNHAQLHAASTGVMVGAVMEEGQRVVGKVEEVKDDTVAIRAFFEGGEVPRKEGQTDKARMKELRLLKRKVDNEIGDLKECEQERLYKKRNDGIALVQQAVEVAQGSCALVAGDLMDKATLTAQYKAQMKVLSENEKAARTAERQALKRALEEQPGRAKAKARGKAKGKQAAQLATCQACSRTVQEIFEDDMCKPCHDEMYPKEEAKVEAPRCEACLRTVDKIFEDGICKWCYDETHENGDAASQSSSHGASGVSDPEYLVSMSEFCGILATAGPGGQKLASALSQDDVLPQNVPQDEQQDEVLPQNVPQDEQQNDVLPQNAPQDEQQNEVLPPKDDDDNQSPIFTETGSCESDEDIACNFFPITVPSLRGD